MFSKIFQEYEDRLLVYRIKKKIIIKITAKKGNILIIVLLLYVLSIFVTNTQSILNLLYRYFLAIRAERLKFS